MASTATAKAKHKAPTAGQVTDYAFILSRIEELAKLYQIKEVAFDRFGAASVVTALQEVGLEVVQFGQGYISIAPDQGD